MKYIVHITKELDNDLYGITDDYEDRDIAELVSEDATELLNGAGWWIERIRQHVARPIVQRRIAKKDK